MKREEVKRCPKCGKTKPLSMYNKNRTRPLGVCDYCRECTRVAGKEYKKSQHGKAVIKRIYDSLPTNKRQVTKVVFLALKDGTISKPSACCINNEDCSGGIEAHHYDYAKPFDILWLCKHHHTQIHLVGKDFARLAVELEEAREVEEFLKSRCPLDRSPKQHGFNQAEAYFWYGQAESTKAQRDKYRAALGVARNMLQEFLDAHREPSTTGLPEARSKRCNIVVTHAWLDHVRKALTQEDSEGECEECGGSGEKELRDGLGFVVDTEPCPKCKPPKTKGD